MTAATATRRPAAAPQLPRFVPMFQLGGFERSVRAVLEWSQEQDNVGPEVLVPLWSQRQMIRSVFRALPHAALTVERVHEVAQALNACAVTQGSIRCALSSLVRQKVLRSRVEFGQRLYEVNTPV